VYGAKTLYNKTIPRQDQLRVDLDEMADAGQWEEYMKIITPNKEWLMQRAMDHVTIKSRDNLTLHADYVKADGDSDTIVIASHGYTGCGLKDCASISTYFLKNGTDCLIVDNRAHGKSEGQYVGFGILDRYDLLEWIKYVNKRFDGKKKIILYGVSMGGATVLMTTGLKEIPDNVKAVVADCAFTSPYDVFAHVLKKDYHMAEFPVMNINNVMCRKNAGYGFKDYSTLTAVKETNIPILFIHGEKDDFVPTWMSEKNYEVCNSPKELLIVPNAAHAASYYENTQQYEEKVSAFVDKYVK
ncbi:MAG: alpha/beta hydrolase, partial [Oscillospiraceae bacterium]|nr:alpha/beta hydrolase [Oscillospiraceae bacterium]